MLSFVMNWVNALVDVFVEWLSGEHEEGERQFEAETSLRRHSFPREPFSEDCLGKPEAEGHCIEQHKNV
jgi:hypothetical protein